MERARLYVTISPDLGAEREVIGRAVAGLPVDVGWEVGYTPGPTTRRPTRAPLLRPMCTSWRWARTSAPRWASSGAWCSAPGAPR
ncbi:MAG: hypothetical protein KIT87_10445 [Anaerolineae bacterium]|nr:hypothetical protein [Anaerolineae bacterium]